MDKHFDLLFSRAQVQFLTGSYNECAPDWREDNVRFNFHKLYFFQEGEGKLEIEGDTYLPKPGELFFIPAGIKHSYSHNPKKPVVKYWCHFELTFGEKASINYVPKAVKCIPEKESMILPFKRLLDAASKAGNPVNIMRRKAALLELLALYFDQVSSELFHLFEQPSRDFATQVRDYAYQNLGSPLTVAQMAGAFHLQPNYFIQKFKKSFQVTPVQYRNHIRLEAAADRMIRLRDQKLEIVAASCGFEDYRYFSRIFKKRYGVTPSVYRSCHPFGGTL